MTTYSRGVLCVLVAFICGTSCRGDEPVLPAAPATTTQASATVQNPEAQLTITELGELRMLKQCADATYEPQVVRYGDSGHVEPEDKDVLGMAMKYFLLEDSFVGPCIEAFDRYNKLIPSERALKFPGVALTPEQFQERIKSLRKDSLRRLAEIVNYDGPVAVHLPVPESWGDKEAWNNGRLGLLSAFKFLAEQDGFATDQVLPGLDERFLTLLRKGCRELSDHIEEVRKTNDIEPHRKVLCEIYATVEVLAKYGQCQKPVPPDLCLTQEEYNKLHCDQAAEVESEEEEPPTSPAVAPTPALTKPEPPPSAPTVPEPPPEPETVDEPATEEPAIAPPPTIKRARRVRSIANPP